VTKQTGQAARLTVAGTREDTQSTQESLDRLSLRQALLDFEVANARVIDLVSRLREAQDELVGLRLVQEATDTRDAEIAALRAELFEMKSRHEEVTQSSTYRMLMVLSRFRVRIGF
jgi:hypothetical protein